MVADKSLSRSRRGMGKRKPLKKKERRRIAGRKGWQKPNMNPIVQVEE
jgi:hypothetical protein